MAEILLTAVSKTYPGNHGQSTLALSNVSLRIPDHSFFTFLGESGSGKTTLLKVIAGLEPYESGTIHFNGVEASHLSLKEKNMAMVSQNIVLYPHASIYENVMLGLYPLHLSESEMKQRILEAARICQMEPYLTRRPAQLSGGQKQRAAIMRAIARKADVVMMDEPLSNIESPFREELLQSLVRIKEECHSTFLYATHDLAEAFRLSDQIALLSKGRLLQCAEPITLSRKPQSIDVFRFINPGKSLVLPLSSEVGYPAGTSQIGILSEDLRLSKSGGRLKSKVKALRFGASGGYALDLLLPSGQEISLDVATTDFPIGLDLFLDWDQEKTFAFSPEGIFIEQGENK